MILREIKNKSNGVNIMSDITIIGTSNSIMGRNGYIKALETYHNINNFSLGRCPFYMHIKTIIENKKEIENGDILIIDHLSNPFYDSAPYFDKDLELFYDYLASLNTNIIILSMPYINANTVLKKTALAKELAKKRKLTFVDLNSIKIDHSLFKDQGHLNLFSSYLMGIWLLIIIDNFKTKVFGGKFEGGFEVIKPDSRTEIFKNSLLERKYLDLTNSKSVTFKSNGRLASVEFLANGISTFSINSNSFHVKNEIELVCHEPFMKKIIINNNLILNNKSRITHPVFKDRINNHLMKETSFKFICFVVKLEKYNFVYAKERKEFKIDYNVLEKWMDQCLKLSVNPSNNIIDNVINEIRDLAISFETENLTVAYKLMNITNKLRPNGPLIKRKLLEYDNILNEKKQNHDKQNITNHFLLKDKTINTIRDLAINYENSDLELAHDLMLIAHKARPTGPFIKQKLEEYKKIIDSKI
jgi:hypothetical protein